MESLQLISRPLMVSAASLLQFSVIGTIEVGGESVKITGLAFCYTILGRGELGRLTVKF